MCSAKMILCGAQVKIVCVLAKISDMITYLSHDELVFMFIPIYLSYLVQCRNNI
jgi:hypothetical protein